MPNLWMHAFTIISKHMLSHSIVHKDPHFCWSLKKEVFECVHTELLACNLSKYRDIWWIRSHDACVKCCGCMQKIGIELSNIFETRDTVAIHLRNPNRQNKKIFNKTWVNAHYARKHLNLVQNLTDMRSDTHWSKHKLPWNFISRWPNSFRGLPSTFRKQVWVGNRSFRGHIC